MDDNFKDNQDETILLKIKRQFTENEAVNTLLKMLHDSEVEVGILKSELAEAVDKAERIRQERTLTKKQWMQEEVFKLMHEEHERLQRTIKKQGDTNKVWMNKYFSLLASTQKQTT